MNVFGTFRLSRTIIFNNNSNNNIKKDDSLAQDNAEDRAMWLTPRSQESQEYLALPFLYTILQRVHISKTIILCE